jgi:hypothetical protein
VPATGPPTRRWRRPRRRRRCARRVRPPPSHRGGRHPAPHAAPGSPPGCRRGRRTLPRPWRGRRRSPGAAARSRGDRGAAGRRRTRGRADHRRGLRRVRHHGVVERAVRLDVRHARACDPRQGLERADLVGDGIGELAGIHVDEAPTEAGEIGVADLRPDRDPALGRVLAAAAQRGRVAGVEPAGDVGAGDVLEHGDVVAELPPAEGLPEVAVEVDAGSAMRTATSSPIQRPRTRAQAASAPRQPAA